jgi:hypothetical protein
MKAVKSRNDTVDADGVSTALVPHDAEVANSPAWELVDVGRYRPRRIRGSYRGRELG